MSLNQRKLRIAAVLSSAAESGGAFTQSGNIAKLLCPSPEDDYELEYVALDRGNVRELQEQGLRVHHTSGKASQHIERALTHFPAVRGVLRNLYGVVRRGEGSLDALASRLGYDLLVFTSPSRRALSLTRTPFLFTLWDVCHRDHPEFPEFLDDNSFEWRERLFSQSLRRAAGYIVDTPQMADRLVHLYGVDRDKAIIIPYRPSELLLALPEPTEAERARLRSRHGLTREFVFYPAQFWPHKNHAYILRALKLLKESDKIEIDAVFSGSDQGHLDRILQLAELLGIRDQVKYVGFVPIADVKAFYFEALNLVMPTYFGPTNIPPLEAMALGCRVVYSDLPGYREFCGESALYCRLDDPASLADCIKQSRVMPKPAPVPVIDSGASLTLKSFLKAEAAKFAAWKF